MTYEIEYEISLDEDFPNRIGTVRIVAENEKEAAEKFKKLDIFKRIRRLCNQYLHRLSSQKSWCYVEGVK